MILIPIRERFTSITKPVGAAKAELFGIGEPQRREWKAKYEWRLRDGRLEGEGWIEHYRLGQLLDQLARLESGLILPYTGMPASPQQDYWQLKVYYLDTLYRSVNNTVKRYCDWQNRMKVQQPQQPTF